MNPDSYEINFTIPRGDTGPTGPATSTAIGNIYASYSSATANLQPNFVPYQIEITGDIGLNVKYDADTGDFTCLEEGCYIFNYGMVVQILNALPTNKYDVRIFLSINHKTYNNMQVRAPINSDALYNLHTSRIVNLNAGDVVSLIVASDKAADINYFEPYVAGYRLSEKLGRVPQS